MSAPIPSVPSPSAADSTAATGDSGQKSSTASSADASQGISSMEDLKALDPKLYNLTLVSIATKICNEMKHNQDRLKKMWRESQQK